MLTLNIHKHTLTTKQDSNSSPDPPANTTVSDLEEGEIFSDDEESAYYPQLVRSRTDKKRKRRHESESSESDGGGGGERKKRSRRKSRSREKDVYRSRWGRSTERDRDSDSSSLFFEDRDSGKGEEVHGRKSDSSNHTPTKNEGYGSSSGSKYGRDRDRERNRNRDRRERSGGHHRRERESHRGRDHDSSLDSSEEESSSWSRHRSSGVRTYQSYQKGRRGQPYQQKYGQKYGGGGRLGERDSGNWAPAPGRMNTGMSAQQFHTLAEKVRKRREKGMSLLPTPKMKPSDNLDQFNYSACPSWYTEAVEKWEKMNREESERQDESNADDPAPTFDSIRENRTVSGTAPAMEPPIIPNIYYPIPSLFDTITPSAIPVVGQEFSSGVVACNSRKREEGERKEGEEGPVYFRGGGGGGGGWGVDVKEGGVRGVGIGGGEGGGGGGGGHSGWVGIGEVREGCTEGQSSGFLPAVKTVSSLALSLEEINEEEEENDDDIEGGQMKIALETPTPRADANVKTSEVFNEEKEENVPSDTATNEEREEERMEVDKLKTLLTGEENLKSGDSSERQASLLGLTSTLTNRQQSQTGTDFSSMSAPSNSAPGNLSLATDVTTATPPLLPPNFAMATPSVATPSFATPHSKPLAGSLAVETTQNENEMELEDNFDYDDYLDQLDEEEDLVGLPHKNVLTSNLLLVNPLEEDFPAIDPANEVAGKEKGKAEPGGSLKLLVETEMEESREWSKEVLSKGKGVYVCVCVCVCVCVYF